MSKYEPKINKEHKQINDSILSENQFKMNPDELRKKKSVTLTDFNKNLKDSKDKLTYRDVQSNKNNSAGEQKAQQIALTSLNPGKVYKVYTDQGNKNSILFKFRSEINKSQQIVDREVERAINLKNKYSKKRLRTTELKMRSNFQDGNQNSPQKNLKNAFDTAINNNDSDYFNTNNNLGKFNFQNTFRNLNNNNNNNYNNSKINNSNNEASGFSQKFKTATGFFKNENNNSNNLFNTQIKMNDNDNNKEKENQIDYYLNNNNVAKTPEKNQFDPLNRANSQNINGNQNNSSFKKSAINQVNHFPSMSNRTAGMLGLNSNNNNNNLNIIGGSDTGNAPSNKQINGFNATGDKFFQGSKMASNRIKTYNVYFIHNWYEKNQIPFQNYTPHMVNNIEFQSNTIIDQMRVLLDSINYFKMQFMQGKNLVTIFKNLDPKRQVKYNKSLEEACGLLMEISIMILMDFTQYLEKFASIQPPSKERLNKSEVKDEEVNFFYNIKLFADITVYLKGCFEVYLILIKQLDDMLLQYKTFLKLLQFLARSRLGVSNLIFTAKNAFKNYCSDQSSVNKYIGVVLDINKTEEAELKENRNEIGFAAAPRSKKINNGNYPRIPKTANFKVRMDNEDLSEKIRKQFMFRLNEDNQKIIRLNNVLNRKEFDNDDSFEMKKKEISKKMLQGSCLNSNLVTKLLKYCPKQVKNQIISQRIIEMYKEKEAQKN